MATTAPAPVPLSKVYVTRTTDDLLTLLTEAVDDYPRTQRAEEIAAAAAVLQRRVGGRITGVGTRDTANPAQAVCERVDVAGGFLVMNIGNLRTTLASAPKPPRIEGAPGSMVEGGPTIGEMLDSFGLDLFPSRRIAGTFVQVIVHETGTVLAELLAALFARDAIEADRLTEEIRTTAGQTLTA